MCLITLPAPTQSTFFFHCVISALSLLSLLALLILAMKRQRPSPTPTDLEDQKFSIRDEPCTRSSSGKGAFSSAVSPNEVPPGSETPTVKVPGKKSPRRKRRKAIPERMRYMRDHMTVWGDRWFPAVEPSTPGSQVGEIDPSGTYTASRSPPPSYRTTPSPLSPVVMASSSSPIPHRLSSDFKPLEDYTPPPMPQGSPSLADIFLFGDSFSLDGGADPSSRLFNEDPYTFDFNSETSFSHNPHTTISSVQPPTSTPPHPAPYVNSMAVLDFHSGGPLASNLTNGYGTYPIHGASHFSDWIPPPTMQPDLSVNNVAHFTDGLPYNPTLSFSSPSQNVTNFPTTAWTSHNLQQRGGVGPSMPLVGAYSTSPMSTPPIYTGHGSPYIPMPDRRSPVYHRSGSGSPLALYPGQTPHYYPYPSLSPLTARTASSGSVASLFSMDNHSPHSIPSELYGDFDYNYSSPHSTAFTGSPSSISSPYGGLESFPGSTSRTVPLPFPPPPHPNNSSWL